MKKFLFSLLVFTFTSFGFLQQASANNDINGDGRIHAIADYDVSGIGVKLEGLSMYSSNPNTTSYWSSSCRNRFIAKPMWITTSGGTKLIEAGFYEGGVITSSGYYSSDTMYEGVYVGWTDVGSNGQPASYFEKRLDKLDATPGNAHRYDISYDGTNTYWHVYVDGNWVESIYGWTGDGNVQHGTEVQGSTYCSGYPKLNYVSYTSNLKYKKNGTWYNWNGVGRLVDENSQHNIRWANSNTELQLYLNY